ncbi:hypothetical protein C8R42DRAFT_744448 [Lentinula raphanica]|nr:hypothetical protein C8R42DRAFT_744448 [Lentinula raphanica]
MTVRCSISTVAQLVRRIERYKEPTPNRWKRLETRKSEAWSEGGQALHIRAMISLGNVEMQQSALEAEIELRVSAPKFFSFAFFLLSSNTYGHDWSQNALGENITDHGRHLIDGYSCMCGLQGVNLSGSPKSPSNHDNDTFPYNAESMTFVDRPFPLEEAPEHLARLRRWGLAFIRFLVTWEEAFMTPNIKLMSATFPSYFCNMDVCLCLSSPRHVVALLRWVWSTCLDIGGSKAFRGGCKST